MFHDDTVDASEIRRSPPQIDKTWRKWLGTLRDHLTLKLAGKWIRIEDVWILLKMGMSFQPSLCDRLPEGRFSISRRGWGGLFAFGGVLLAPWLWSFVVCWWWKQTEKGVPLPETNSKSPWKSPSFLGFIPSKWWIFHGYVSLQEGMEKMMFLSYDFWIVPTMILVIGSWLFFHLGVFFWHREIMYFLSRNDVSSHKRGGHQKW